MLRILFIFKKVYKPGPNLVRFLKLNHQPSSKHIIPSFFYVPEAISADRYHYKSHEPFSRLPETSLNLLRKNMSEFPHE